MLLDEAITALNDWVHLYAPEFSDAEAVKETQLRVWGEGGTLSYITKLKIKLEQYKKMKLTNTETKLLQQFLINASETLGNSSCNDYILENTEEHRNLVRDAYLSNVNGDFSNVEDYIKPLHAFNEAYENETQKNIVTSDVIVFDHLAKKLINFNADF